MYLKGGLFVSCKKKKKKKEKKLIDGNNEGMESSRVNNYLRILKFLKSLDFEMDFVGFLDGLFIIDFKIKLI